MSIILTCNTGSTNTKLTAYDAHTLERIAHATTHGDAETAEWLCSVGTLDIDAIGHRVVHGGRLFTHPVVIDTHVVTQLESYVPLAPLHQPAALKLIRQTQAYYPKARQIACFDTAFHQSQLDIERSFPLPSWYHYEGIQRYGFHGLSYEHVASELPDIDPVRANGRVVAVHLGGGASACAMIERRSVATTMGFSTLDGMVMSTRSGSLDPGVILYLLEQLDMKPKEVRNLLYLQSGLQGVSGISGDIRELIQKDSPKARKAIDLYCHSAARQIAGLLPSIGGLDMLIFTGGIGEHQPAIRRRIADSLGWAGDFEVHTVPSDEARVIARACYAIMHDMLPADV